MPIPRHFPGQVVELFLVQRPNLVDVRVVFQDRGAFLFREHVQFRVGIAPPQEFERGRGEHHVPDLAELADEDAPGREGGEIDGHDWSAPTSCAMRRHMEARFSV